MTPPPPPGAGEPTSTVMDRLRALRTLDAPTHGGRLLSYVYDSGQAELDDLAAQAVHTMLPVNGLDPTAFPSVAVIESEILAFAIEAFGGSSAGEVVGSVTSGGTESCLLAVKTARDAWRARRGAGPGSVPRLVAPSTVHAAFHKAAHLFDLGLDLVPVDAETGRPRAADLLDRLGDDVALLVMSAPSYPVSVLDPIAEVAPRAAALGVDVHVDACLGGFALAFWPEDLPPWDLRVPGVVSLSADLHKYGYAPKGASVLLQRGRDRQRLQYFATARWPGYPVVNPTLLGSRSAGPAAAAWAILRHLGRRGFEEISRGLAATTSSLAQALSEIEGLRIVGERVGPMIALAADEAVPAAQRVDPHRWADAMGRHGFAIQQQPGHRQADGTRLPHTAHLTITPVTTQVLEPLVAAAAAAAAEVRGAAPLDVREQAAALVAAFREGDAQGGAVMTSGAALAALQSAGLLTGAEGAGALPDDLAPVLALVEELPAPVVERLLIELLARGFEPPTGGDGVH
ncbi:pyridoxal phosphate-dependent decarboxylase family protein [Serinibacter salmoneus]|uniref:Glutamate/tyrosine decarboxylase-like PLP-dependent enzyme n=1 Tax=Serinibacter salmoneus TaxID=556530 RepID=A0A2A9D0C2_9MICO|nr:pyridoxal-dependent decarboxylase [Serinibacter salmoneus]PFG19705.1 glutamate/tyrosine decarboxylase-like PLP-dependent enzyme [Serinibacter salmoneus]